MPKKRKPTVIELFAGTGLFGSAFVAEGFRSLLGVEVDVMAAATYRANLGEDVVVSDVRTLKYSGICDVLLAAPPCQSFSTLNRNRCEDARRSLPLCVAEWARICRPRIIIVENVAPFLNSPECRLLTRRLHAIGYDVCTKVLAASDFDVPQYRQRAILVASAGPLFSFPIGKGTPNKTLADAWAGLSAEPDGRNHHVAPKPSAIALARMKLIPRGGDKRDIMRLRPSLSAPSWDRVGENATDVWGRMHWNEPSNTIRTCCQNASKGRYIHPEQNRVMSLREAARLQTFPDDWKFVGLATHVARQIGNAVPLNLGRAIAASVRQCL